MKLVRLSLPLFLIVVSIIFFISTLTLDRAQIGDPNAVIYFPLLCSIGLFICALMYLRQELKELRNEATENEDMQLFVQKKTMQTIGLIVALCLGYTVIFESLGFILSTLLLLGALLFYLNGLKKWMMNLLVTITFTSLFFIAFKLLLDVNLP